jgi:hypothetical protein
MAYAPHWLLNFGGELDPLANSSWQEIWQCSMRFREVTAPDPESMIDDFKTVLSAYVAASANQISAWSRLSFVKLNHIGADGLYTDPSHPHTRHFTGVPGAGITTGNAYPTAMSLAYTWTTARVRGVGSKGRMFLPNSWARSSAGADVIPVANQTTVADAAKGLLTNFQTAGGDGDIVPCIASKVDASLTDVTGVRIGRVVDSQRRRRNALSEEYFSTPWPG